MIVESVAAAALAAGVVGVVIMRRSRHYERLAARLHYLKRVQPPHEQSYSGALPAFDDRIVAVADFLSSEHFEELRHEVEAIAQTERSYVPSHKKGGTIAYETLIEKAPAVTSLYHSEAMAAFVSAVTGVAVRPTPLSDQSSLSVLRYERPGDHIGWHYDHNFYRGRHFTVLLAVVNRGTLPDGLSHARLRAKIGGGQTELPTPPNTLVIFEGASVVHKATPLEADERRVLISMTYCADARATIAQGVARRMKDTAFFGLRALWT